jgi:drug/metabolite transporter (DMT)-like permease
MSAATFGAADFLGGLASRRSTSTVTVVLLSQTVGLSLLIALLLVFGGDLHSEDIWWAGGAGIAGVIGLVLLYRGFSIGTISVVAPITGLVGALVPLAWGLVTGERPSWVAGIGIVIALGAVVLVSGASSLAEFRARAGMPEAVGAGAGFGIFFVLISNASSAELWLVAFSRAASISLLLGVVVVRGIAVRPAPGVARLVVASGTGDAVANLLFLAAERRGLLSLVAVIASLYPATTVLLARVVLKERMSRLQQVGLGLAALGVALIGFF